jgi:hypothetical protein
MVLAGLLWCAGVAVTVVNTAGYVGEHIEQYQVARETKATERNVAMERLARLRDERKAIAETRPPVAILAAMAGTRRSEHVILRHALALIVHVPEHVLSVSKTPGRPLFDTSSPRRAEKRMGEAPWPGFEAVQRDRCPGIRARRRGPFQEPSLFTLLKKDERG